MCRLISGPRASRPLMIMMRAGRPRSDRGLDMSPAANMPVLEVKDLKKHFPVRKGLLRRTVGHVYAVDGISFSIGVGETLGPGGRERLRQDHRRPRRAAPDRADLGLGAGRRHRDHRPVQIGDAPLPGADADHLPGPVLLAQSAHDGGRDRGRAAAGARHRPPQGARRAGRGPVRPRRPAAGADEQLPAPVLGRPAPAHRHRPRARARAPS